MPAQRLRDSLHVQHDAAVAGDAHHAAAFMRNACTDRRGKIDPHRRAAGIEKSRWPARRRADLKLAMHAIAVSSDDHVIVAEHFRERIAKAIRFHAGFARPIFQEEQPGIWLSARRTRPPTIFASL